MAASTAPDATGDSGAKAAAKPKKTTSQAWMIYRPEDVSPPERFLPNPDYIVVDPEKAGGSGLTITLNYLLRERGIYEHMGRDGFYYLHRKFTPTGQLALKEEGHFSYILKEVMRAWYEHGLCPDSLLPDTPGEIENLSPEQTQAALKYRPAALQSIPKDADLLKAAIYEHHAVVAGVMVHAGWFRPLRDGKIDFKPKDLIRGGLAVAVLGYTPDGFLVQNQWGPEWGGVKIGDQFYPGAALITYPDFEAHYSEGYVATLPPTLVGRYPVRRAGFDSDTLDNRDRLDIDPDVKAVCRLLAARDVRPPLALGLFGNWGTGKSFFMARMLEEIRSLARLEHDNPGQTPYCSEVVQIRFNAWHYLDANLWASLVSEIFNRLFAAVSGDEGTPESRRKRLVRQLSQARGLYRQAQIELEQARHERESAQASLKEKSEQVRAQSDTVRDLRNQLVTLLADEPAVRKDLHRLERELGVQDLAQSYQALCEQAGEIRTFGDKVRKLLRVAFDPRGRRDRLILLIGVLVVPALIGGLVSVLAQNGSALLEQISRVVNLPTGLLVTLVLLLARLPQGIRVVDSLQSAVDRVERVRAQRLEAVVQPEQVKLEQSLQAERAAQARDDAARRRAETLEKEVAELSPGHQLLSFISERGASQDYRAQLGVVSLVRRDFERLSDLLQTNRRLEDHWYDRRQKAQQAGTTFTRPKPRLLPLQRIILYIDDLDRCPPNRVIEVLEAVHLLLAFPLFVVVVAVDPRWLRQCLEIHYPDLLSMDTGVEEDEEGLRQPSTPQDFLEKIFQIPFYLRPLSDAGYRGLIDGLAGVDVALPPAPPAPAHEPSNRQGESDANAAEQAGTQLTSMLPPKLAPGVATEVQPGPMAKAEAGSRLNPEQLRLRPWELEDMKRLAPLFHTPRAVKRFVNTYRLIRVGIPDSELSAFEGTAHMGGRYRTAQVLLAIVCGHPNSAPRFLRRLMEQSRAANSQSATWAQFLKDCMALAKTAGAAADGARARNGGDGAPSRRQGAAAAKPPKVSRQEQERAVAYYWREWLSLCETLQQISRDGFLPDKLKDYYALVPRVARFSFSVSMLPE